MRASPCSMRMADAGGGRKRTAGSTRVWRLHGLKHATIEHRPPPWALTPEPWRNARPPTRGPRACASVCRVRGAHPRCGQAVGTCESPAWRLLKRQGGAARRGETQRERVNETMLRLTRHRVLRSAAGPVVIFQASTLASGSARGLRTRPDALPSPVQQQRACVGRATRRCHAHMGTPLLCVCTCAGFTGANCDAQCCG